jgi:streptogramin lyase
MRSRFVIALASALAVGIAASALALGADAGRDTARPAIAPGPLRVAAGVDVGGHPSSLAVTDGAVWASLGLGGIVRIDPETNRVVARIEPGGAVVALAAGFGSVWAVDVFGDRLLRIDPATNEVIGTTAAGALPAGVAVGFGSVWVTNHVERSVTRVDPESGRVVATTRLDWSELWPGAIVAGPGGIWVVTGGGSEVTRIDPRTGRVDFSLPVGGARSLATVGDALWVGLAWEKRLMRIDRSGAKLVRVQAPRANGYGPELAGGDVLWHAVPGSVGRLRPPAWLQLALRDHVSAIATAAGDVWVAEQDAGRVLRIRVQPEDVR